MQIRTRLEEIAAKEAARLTKSDKDYIVSQSKKMGVAFKPRPHCPNCYADQAIVLWNLAKEQQAHEAAYVLHAGVDVTFKGHRINERTITDELAEQLIKEGLPTYLFIKCK